LTLALTIYISLLQILVCYYSMCLQCICNIHCVPDSPTDIAELTWISRNIWFKVIYLRKTNINQLNTCIIYCKTFEHNIIVLLFGFFWVIKTLHWSYDYIRRKSYLKTQPWTTDWKTFIPCHVKTSFQNTLIFDLTNGLTIYLVIVCYKSVLLLILNISCEGFL
jgi:hypothetical protein